MRTRFWLAGPAAALCIAAGALAPAGSDAGAAASADQKRPNVLVVMTDDQTVESMRLMPRVREQLVARGVNFANNTVSFPLCCPSRATFLTGQYSDNNGVRGNQAPTGGYTSLDHSNTLPVWLQRAGYYTSHIGKYLNGYGSGGVPDTTVPPGWDDWQTSLDDPDAYTGGTYTMYGYTLNENGAVVHYGSTPAVVDPATYQTDVYSAKAEAVIRSRAPSGQPFFLWVTPLAPHGEANACNCTGNDPRAAPRHEGALAAEPVPRPPSFNEADVGDKPAEIQNLTTMNQTQIGGVDSRYRARGETLLAVDEMVSNLIGALKETGELDDTLIVFTSDNGFFHGEHRIRQGKVRHYTESSEVPLVIRGPGVPQGETRKQLVANIDLAPTILDYANAAPGRTIDGRSLSPYFGDKRFDPGRGILIEAFQAPNDAEPDEPNVRYSAVRTDRYVYAEHGNGDAELYDLRDDPFELSSLHADPAMAAVRSDLDALLARLTACAGKGCGSAPALKLKLGYRRGRDARGRCVRSRVKVAVAGGDRGDAIEAAFRVRNRSAGTDSSGALKRKLGRGLLSRKAKNRVTAVATTLDGRNRYLTAAAPRACR